jgi:hypothetical protein
VTPLALLLIFGGIALISAGITGGSIVATVTSVLSGKGTPKAAKP